MIMFLTLLLTVLFSCASTAILSYIAMAVMLGPWIDSTVVLGASIIFAICARTISINTRHQSIALVTIGASVGGIVATACGFAFPTLYFLDKNLFATWVSNPLFFCAVMGALVFCAGFYGILLANLFENRCLVIEKMPFPIGELSYKMIAAQDSHKKTRQLSVGFLISFLYSALVSFVRSIPSSMTLLPSISYRMITIPALTISLAELPMLWAIGFIAGHSIAIPLGIGIIAKNLLCLPTHAACFTHLGFNDFLVAFSSGMVAYGALISFLTLPSAFKGFWGTKQEKKNAENFFGHFTKNTLLQWCIFLLISYAFFYYFEFSLLAFVYLLLATAVCTYQLLIIGGKIGIAPLARYATFVMIPAMMFFGYNPIHIMIISTFVEICGGIAVELLFGRKLGYLSSLPSKKIRCWQWFGLIICALVIGACFWLLITRLGLGSSQLVAQRSQSRALLVMVQSFDYYALILGALFASVLKELKINAIMVLGGLLMPTNLALPLVLGGLSSIFAKDKESQYPFWSGIFAANSLWMFIKIAF
jgi:hypothetical protein